MRKNINKAKLIGESVLRKIVAMSLAISIGCFGANFRVNAQSGSGFQAEQTSLSANVPQEGNLSQNDFDDFSCLFNFFCCVPVVFLTIFRVIADVVQRFGPTSSKDK